MEETSEHGIKTIQITKSDQDLQEIGGTGFLLKILPKGRQMAHVSNAELRDTSAKNVGRGTNHLDNQVLGSMSEDLKERIIRRIIPWSRSHVHSCA